MARDKARATFVCQLCGTGSPKWLGRCPDCGEWNSLVETAKVTTSAPVHHGPASASPVQELTGVLSAEAARILTPVREVNRVLGGGLVPGSLVLVGGDPGIGKSTLLLQIAQAIANSHGPVLYVSGEESAQQVRLRADRLGLKGERLFFLAETEMESVLQRLEEMRPSLVIIDSIQTMYLSRVESVAGSVSQVRECTLRLMQWAKLREVPAFIAGHVTKDGAIAGPRLLEHMVDVVLYLEGENFSSYRLLRGVKNRFGSTNEVGIFEMRDCGLVEVTNPSQALLSQRQSGAIGSAITATLEGTRPLLIEVQALVTPTGAPVPRRTSNGVDFNRLLLICAVLTKHLGISLSTQDIVVNVTGGVRVAEPAGDLAIATAIVSSLRDTPVKPGVLGIGEIGLTGELRSISQLERRLSEAVNMGFKSAIVPKAGLERLQPVHGLEVAGVGTLREAMGLVLAERAALGQRA